MYKHNVTLKLFQDDATGDWGVSHPDSIDKGFNAFWNADGIFHDVLEHYFENEHKYFTGNAAYKIWGEMCASGHGIAYRQIGIDNFQYRKYGTTRDFMADTSGLLEDYIDKHTDYVDFGLENCKVPRQKDPESYDLNHWISEYHYWLEQHINEGKFRANEIRKSNITNCYRLGYKIAKRIIGNDKSQAYNALQTFLEQWHKITSHNSAQYLSIKPESEDDYDNDLSVWGFKFYIKQTGSKLSIVSKILNQQQQEHHINKLISY